MSKDAEKAMINLLNVECGFNNVNKLTKMCDDIDSSVTIDNSFKAWSHKGIINGVELSMKVLNMGVWPELKS